MRRWASDDHHEDGNGDFHGITMAAVVASILSAGLGICLPAHASSPSVNQSQVSKLAKDLKEVEKIWQKAAGRDDQLSLNETLSLFKSNEILAAVKKMAKGVEVSLPSDNSIKNLFKIADKDNSNRLNKLEFLGLFLGVFAQTIVANPLVMANVLIDFIDKDKDGKLEGKEIKGLLKMVGIPPVALMLVPDNQEIDYRTILGIVGPKC